MLLPRTDALSELSAAEWREVVAEACRAPSVHNAQPARWRAGPNGRVELLRARNRSLHAADPTGRAVRASVGAAFEGTALALSRRGFALTEPALLDELESPTLALVAVSQLVNGADEDPLASWTSERSTYRGVFERVRPDVVHALQRLEASDARVVTAPRDIVGLARTHDAVRQTFFASPAFQAEFHSWLRLRRSHPDWERDGLTAPCLELSPFRAGAASLLLHPSLFSWARRSGLAGALLSESRAIRSAAAVVLFAPLREDDAFLVGRRFYRLWLELTRAGCQLCPLSALARHEPTARELERRFAIPSDRRLANAFRVGVAPHVPARSARLPVEELLL